MADKRSALAVAGLASDSPLPTWPCTAEPPLHHGVIKQIPADFRVTELPLLLPEGEGEHLWVNIRKTGWNTVGVAGLLSRATGARNGDVSYAGLKDRQAVTEQWFSIHLPGRETPRLPEVLADGVEVLEQQRHSRKLRRGALKGNRFEIVLRQCRGAHEDVAKTLARLQAQGFPNYFGEQRFGRDGANITKARQMLRGKRRVKDREQRSLLISSARSLVFNDVLALRVERGTWYRPLLGDLMLLGESNSLFSVDTIDDALLQRAENGEIHPSGPLPGTAGKTQTTAEAAALEQLVLEPHAAIVKGLTKQRVAASRRALRVMPQQLQSQWLDEETLALSFSLPPGSYATALLRELVSR